ncbi:capsular polysaccharide export protein, LipB/KpsS family [Halomonas litopenaei]|uniref:capsular polysaccharide export protein, LipB/KpsS family n=1 Tax=Halomonas litopenaei TaxID=2109328 RepID=UPI003FA06639
MTVLVFDPAYSDYMQDLGEELARISGERCEAVLSSNAYAIYTTRLDKNVYQAPNVIQEPRCDVKLTANALVWGCKNIQDNQRFYEQWLRDIFRQKSPTFCIFHNERFLLCALGITLCKEMTIPFVVIERGAFRPVTTSADSRGTNANSIFRSITHDDSMDTDVIRKFNFNKKRKPRLNLLPKFLFFILWAYFEIAFKSHRRYLFHKKYSLSNYLGLFVEFCSRKLLTNKGYLPDTGDRKILLVALQRPGDTQLTFSKEFPGMQEMIDIIASAAEKLDSSWDVWFKVHPFDTARYDTKGFSFIREGVVSHLIENSAVVLTFNSTVGFEALLFERPCVCLGESFFTKPEYVYKTKNLSSDEIAKTIEQAYKTGFKKSKFSIISNVLNAYQIPGDIFRYDDEDIGYAAELIYARHADG